MNEERMCDEWVFWKCASEVATCKAEPKVRWKKDTPLHQRYVSSGYFEREAEEQTRLKSGPEFRVVNKIPSDQRIERLKHCGREFDDPP